MHRWWMYSHSRHVGARPVQHHAVQGQIASLGQLAGRAGVVVEPGPEHPRRASRIRPGNFHVGSHDRQAASIIGRQRQPGNLRFLGIEFAGVDPIGPERRRPVALFEFQIVEPNRSHHAVGRGMTLATELMIDGVLGSRVSEGDEDPAVVLGRIRIARQTRRVAGIPVGFAEVGYGTTLARRNAGNLDPTGKRVDRGPV